MCKVSVFHWATPAASQLPSVGDQLADFIWRDVLLTSHTSDWLTTCRSETLTVKSTNEKRAQD